MATFTKLPFSESSGGGRGVKIGATTSPGTLIHDCSTTPGDLDEVWLYATNSSTSAIKLTVEFGAQSSPDDTIEITVPGEAGLILIVPGLVLEGVSPTPQKIRAFAVNSNVLVVHGYVNRIS